MARFFSAVKKEVAENLLDYLVLTTGSVLFLVLLGSLRGEKTKSFFVLAGFVFFYIIWGIYHHAHDETLHRKTVLEYVLIGFIALFILAIAFLI